MDANLSAVFVFRFRFFFKQRGFLKPGSRCTQYLTLCQYRAMKENTV